MADRIGLSLDCVGMDGNFTKLQTELSGLAELGCPWVELQIHGLDLIWRGQLVAERLTKLREITAALPLRYTVHAPDVLNLMAAPEERPYHLAALHASIDVAAAIGAPLVNLHPGRYVAEEAFGSGRLPATDDRIELLEMEADLLRELGAHAQAAGVQIALENMRPYADGSPYCYGELPDLLAEQVGRVDHPAVGMTLDLGHAHLAARMYAFDLLPMVTAVAPLVRHVHLSDNYGVASRSTEKAQGGLVAVGRGDLHAPPGCGDAPLAAALQRLEAFAGVTILELRTRYRPQFGAALRTTAAMWEQASRAQ